MQEVVGSNPIGSTVYEFSEVVLWEGITKAAASIAFTFASDFLSFLGASVNPVSKLFSGSLFITS